jgi:gliding motility-associated-like protein
MPTLYRRLLCLILLSPFILSGAFGQPTGSAGQALPPGCATPYYHSSYGWPLDGDVQLQSMVVGPDGCIYLGCQSYPPEYSIMKLDTTGNIIRIKSYTASGQAFSPGKTIVDADGNLFSVIFNNHVLRTDTIGNILSATDLAMLNGYSFSFTDVAVLANGDKVFLLEFGNSSYPYQYLVATSPDASVIRWTRYFFAYPYLNTNASIMADGNKILLGIDFFNSYSYNAPDNSGIIALDGATGKVLHQNWFSRQLNFRQISRYNNGYVFGGTTPAPNTTSFYMRTDTSLNALAAYDFPGYTAGYPFLFRTQPDGSIYGMYSNTESLSLFLVSPGDVIQWASGVFGFYQFPNSMVLDPSGIFIGTGWGATDVISGGPLSGMELYKSSYSGYFPACALPQSATMKMAAFSLSQAPEIVSLRDTSAFVTSGGAIGPASPPGLIGSTCTGTPTCHSITISGNPNVCTGSGTFTGNLDNGCPMGITWSVTDGPGTAAIQPTPTNSATIQFPQAGTYKVKALINSNCTIFGDSLLVHVNMPTVLSLGRDTLLCAGSSLLLHAGNEFNSYAWQDGSTDSTLLVTAPGQYNIKVSDYCGNSYNSSINVSYLPPLNAPFPPDITKCPADTLILPFPSGFDSVYFSAGATNFLLAKDSIEFYNTVTADYFLRVRDKHGCTVNSPIQVQIYSMPTLSIGNDTTICPGDSIRLDAGAGFSTFAWSTGSQNQTIWAAGKGTYWVAAASANGCVLRDSMRLADYPAPVVHLDADTLLCAGTTRTLFAGNGFAAYRWDDGSAAASLSVSSPGQYWVDVSDGHGCATADTVTIKAIAPLPADFLPGDTTICQYGNMVLAPIGKFSNYSWSDGSTGATLSVQSPGLYTLQVTDKNGCVGSDSIYLTGKQCLLGFYIPNAFTPGRDGRNDRFRPLLYGNVTNYKFAIFNRWGQLVFESTELMQGWDGMIAGTPQPAGGYVWTCEYQLQGEKVQLQRGFMLLIR